MEGTWAAGWQIRLAAYTNATGIVRPIEAVHEKDWQKKLCLTLLIYLCNKNQQVALD